MTEEDEDDMAQDDIELQKEESDVNEDERYSKYN